jgi:hypothetical protein
MTVPLAAAGGNAVVDGTLGFLIVGGMAVVVVFLFRSMSKHLRKVNDAAPDDRPGAARAGRAPADTTGPDPR